MPKFEEWTPPWGTDDDQLDVAKVKKLIYDLKVDKEGLQDRNATLTTERDEAVRERDGFKQQIDAKAREGESETDALKRQVTELQQAVEAAGLRYRFAGQALGGKPADERLQGEDGVPDYDKIAASDLYQDGLSQLLALAAEHCVAIMCSEAHPAQCHREKLIARSLRAQGVEVTHIMPDGSAAAVAQPTLFEDSR